MRKVAMSRSSRRGDEVCRHCGVSATYVHSVRRRTYTDLDDSGQAIRVTLVYPLRMCKACRKAYSVPLPVDHSARYGKRLIERVWAAYVEGPPTETLDALVERIRRRHGVRVPPTTIHDWLARSPDYAKVSRGKKKARKEVADRRKRDSDLASAKKRRGRKVHRRRPVSND